MAISEGERRVMHAGLVDRLGQEVADLLMEHLPPVGWADVATKRDLDHFGEVFSVRLDRGLADLRTELHRDMAKLTRTLMITMVGGFATIAGTAIGALVSILH